MRDDASRARLEEMGFALYVPRGVRGASIDAAIVTTRVSDSAGALNEHGRMRVALIARAESAYARTLLTQVARALAFARIDTTIAPDAARIGGAAGIVVFGASLAREIGAAVPAEQQKSMQWVGTTEPAEVAGNVAAKRALWSELKRLARALAKARG